MKRRDILKGLGLLPLGGTIATLLPAPASASPGRELTGINVPGAIPNIYQNIGVEPVINCRGTLTIIGGSVELPEVVAAMTAASKHNVQIDELAMGVGKRLAELTQAEWGMVSAGCSAGLKHVTAACVAGGDPEKLIRIPHLDGFTKTEVIIPTPSRNFYDHAIRNIGVKIINVATAEEMADAISDRTAMIYMMTGPTAATGPLSLVNIAAMAKPKNIPILVDAAAEILTIPNIYLQQGASVVAYSGGKALRGPQCAGMLLGRKDILLAAWQASAPHHGPCRDNKLGREEHMGMLAAVEAWVKRDHAAEEKGWLMRLETIRKKISGIASVQTTIREPTGLDNRSASMTVNWNPAVLHITGEEVAEDFAINKPRIAVGAGTRPNSTPVAGSAAVTSLSINAAMMQDGEDRVVADRLFEILSRRRTPAVKETKAAATNMEGPWDLEVSFYLGKSNHKIFIEKQEGNWLQGTHSSGFSMQDITGTLEGDQLKLFSTYTAPGDAIPFTFAGTVSGDGISGTVYMGEYRTALFTGKRHVYPATKAPVSIPSGGRRNGNAW